MIATIKSVLSPEDVSEIFDLYRSLPNNVVLNGQSVDRHTVSRVGHFLVTSFSETEFSPYWNKIKNAVEQESGQVATFSAMRVLKYSPGCFINLHQDTNETANTSAIIQLNKDYTGGEGNVGGNNVDLDIGDCVFYNFETLHGVTKVRSGIRYVVNARFLLTKY